MSQTFEFYDARAREAALEAESAVLDNVKERNLRAAQTWRALATQAQKIKLGRDTARDLKAQADADTAAAAAPAE